MMAGQLPSDVIGTTPHYAPIVDHTWLDVDLASYDNYPSDNNSVRVLPKLADLWNPPQTEGPGITLIPNSTMANAVTAKGVPSSEIIREAKKAMMMGLTGKDLGDHLRARFVPNDLVNAKEDLQKLASEQGLLGNVYIDASAFATPNEFEAFLSRHRNRLAQDIVIAESKMTPEVVQVLASKFRKNVVASVTYTEPLLSKYRQHLIATGKISKDQVVDSKESLRKAFLMQPEPAAIPEPKQEEKLSQDAIQKVLTANAEKAELMNRLAAEEMEFDQVKAIVVFAREQMSKGKTGSDLKEILRGKYIAQDLKKAAKYLALIASDGALKEMDGLVKAGRISEKTADSISKIAAKNPVKKPAFEETEKPERTVGIKGFFYALTGKKESSYPEFRAAAVEALRRGKTMEEIRVALKTKIGADTDTVLAEAMNDFNAGGVGIAANKAVQAPKVKVVEDVPEKVTLPSAEQAKQSSLDFAAMFDGSSNDIPIDPVRKQSSGVDIQEMFNMSGIDTFFQR